MKELIIFNFFQFLKYLTNMNIELKKSSFCLHSEKVKVPVLDLKSMCQTLGTVNKKIGISA